jgi:hypothetical protein
MSDTNTIHSSAKEDGTDGPNSRGFLEEVQSHESGHYSWRCLPRL